MKNMVLFRVLFVALLAGVLAGCGGPAPTRMQLEITSPSMRVETTDPEVTVTGIVSDSAATVKVNGVTVRTGSDGAFSHTVALPYGATRIVVSAEKAGATTVNRTINATRRLSLQITTPEKVSVAATNPVTVAGTVSDPAAQVFVTGSPVDLADDGSFSVDVPLHYEETIIKVAVVLDGVEPLEQFLTVKR